LNLELNACMGGMSEGFRRAGVSFDMAVDYDPNACESHERNIGLRPVQLDIHDLVRMARFGAFAPRVDLFVADPPCTPWSMAGGYCVDYASLKLRSPSCPAISGAGNSGILLSEAALLVLQGFPRTWHVAGATKRARMSQIGQAMPPQLSEAVARSYVGWRDRIERAEVGA
jgi:site-specific DNA-cytosine methylase